MASTAQFVTASGRKIKISRDALDRVPTARKARVSVKVGVLVAFAVAMLLVVGVIAIVAVALFGGEKNQPGGNGTTANGQQAPAEVNPYLMTEPSLGGLAMDVAWGQSVVVVLDCSGEMSGGFDAVRDLLRANLITLGDRTTAQLVLAGSEQQKVYPNRPSPPVRWNRATLERQLGSSLAVGPNAVAPGVEKALDTYPQRVVLVAAKAPGAAAVGALADRAKADGVTIDVVQIGSPDPGLKLLATSNGGRHHVIDPAELSKWYREYQSQ